MKERLVGAAVLVAIAVWLVPWVLDGPEGEVETPGSSLQLPSAEEPMPMRTQTLRLGDAPESTAETETAPAVTLPAATPPVEESATAAEPVRTAETQPEVAAEPEPTRVAEARPESAAPAAVAPTPAPTTPAKPPAAAAGDWTVQLGSFSEEANARRLAQRAGTFGHKAEVSSYRSGARTLYRVRVGPQATRAAADAAASSLRAHGLDARVVAAR